MSKGPLLRSLRTVCLAVAALLVLNAAAAATGTTVFGPRTFTRGSGAPKVESVTFPAARGSYIIRMESDGVASASVKVNGREVAEPSDFKPGVKLLERCLTLAESNAIGVELRSKPGSTLRITVLKSESHQPRIVATPSPLPNAAGWNRTNVTVRFTCSTATAGDDHDGHGDGHDWHDDHDDHDDNRRYERDDNDKGNDRDKKGGKDGGRDSGKDGGASSGAVASCTQPITVTTEGAGQVVRGTVVDSRGDTATVTVTLNIDKTAPTIAPAVAPAANAAGWNQAAPTVSFVCADTGSGVASCTPAQVITQEGAAISVPGKVVDIAGNEAVATAVLKIDRTPPAIEAKLNAPVPAGGWFNAPATVSFACSDALSGVADCPPPVTIASDAANRVVSGTAKDRAGNAASTSITVNVDVTPPQVVAHLQPAAGPSGWNSGDVVVSFECIDAASGVVDCPAPRTISSDGKDQAVTVEIHDKAGNTASATATVSIDRAKPTIAAIVQPAANADGWHNGPATVSFTCSDALSGIADCPSPVTVTNDGGSQVVSGTARDNAGNTATASATLNLDLAPPSITASQSPAAAGDVTVHFTCADGGSGIASCPADQLVAAAGGSRTVTGTARDRAGNTATASLLVSFDITKPTIVAAIVPAANAAGWNRTDVDVTFTCSDSGTGIAECSPPLHVTTEGAAQSFTGQARTNAGATATATATVNLDKTAPTITATSTATGWTAQNVTVSFVCSDALSGIAQCPEPIVVSASGTQAISGTAIDKAGNTATTSVQVTIDRAAPAILARPDRPANANGWYNAPLSVSFACDDADSGVASCPATVQLTTEGAAVEANGAATDRAGNSATAKLIARIDLTVPVITAQTTPGPGQSFVVTFTCDDALSGVDVCPAPQTVTAGGPTDVHAEAFDRAGNHAAIDVHVVVDNVPPSITATAAPAANAAGWNRVPVTVAFQCSDSGSGVASCPADRLIDSDGAAQPVSGTATDTAGNSASASVTVSIDRVAPGLSIANPADGATVSISAQHITGVATDTLSGLQSVTCDGSSASLTGSAFGCDVALAPGANGIAIVATDKAGNSTAITLTVTLSGNHSPFAGAGGPYAGETGKTITFSGAESSDPDGDALTYAWSFGDGSTGTGLQPTHSYADAGTFTVTLTVTDSNKTTGSATTSAVVTRPNQPPVAKAGGPYSGDAGATLALSAAGSSDPDGDALTYAWSFSDGGTASGLNPRRTYQSAGTFTATVTVSDGRGGSNTASASVTIAAANRPPQAQIGGPYAGETGKSLTFSAAGSSDPDGDPLTFTWSFGDGGSAVGAAAVHAYAAAGTFPATVTVSDGRGGSSSTSTQVTVTAANRPPVASAGGPYAAKAGEPIQFNASASTDADGDALTFAWSFGDGRSRTGAQPAYAYDAAGSFTASVMVSDGHGGSQSATASVTITAATAATNRPPVANAGGPYSGEAGLPVSFSAALSSDPDGDALVYSWSFSDGGTAAGKQVTHIFATAQGHSATLTVSDVHQAAAQATAAVTVSARADRAPPIVAVKVPSEVLPGADVLVQATASDDVAVSNVRIDVDGMGAADVTSPYQRSIHIPDVASPGAKIAVRVTARDAAGNAATATAAMTIGSRPDVTPPVVTLSHPAETTAGASLRLVAAAQDAVGVASVTFFVNGAAVGTDASAPFEFTYQVPADAGAGAIIGVAAEARDFAGNKGRDQADVPVTANQDTTPPVLALSAPAQALPGASITLTATATDATGVAAVVFLVDGAVIGTTTGVPYEVTYTVPASLPPGAHVALEARASDLSGLETRVTRDVLVVTADAAAGLVTGQVIDDVTGLPAAGATVSLLSDINGPVSAAATTDDRGRFALASSAGPAIVQVRRDGWTTVERHVAVQAGSVTAIFDARLTPLNPAAQTVTPVLGGTLRAGAAALIVPAGALTAAAPMSLTSVGVHALQGLTPLGWAPLASYAIAPGGLSLAAAATLDVPLPAGIAAGTALTLARWDSAASAWRAVALHQVVAGESAVAASVSATGAYAWLRADLQPAPPALAQVGALLDGVAAVPVGQTAVADVTPQPKVIFYQPGVHSDVKAQITPGSPLPSGTPLQVRISERYEFSNDTTVQPPPMVQDFAFFQNGATLAAAYPVTPSLSFDAATLKTGTIGVEVITPASGGGSALVGAAGGHAETGTGESIDVAPQSTTATLAVQIEALPAAALGLALPEGLAFVGGVNLTFAGGTLTAPAVLSLAKPAAVSAGDQLLLLELVELGGQTEFALVGLGAVSGDRIVSSFTLPKNQLAFAGVRLSGRYLFARATTPLGFAAGQVIGSDNAPLANARVSVNDFKVIAVSRVSGYIAAGKLGSLTVTGLDLARSDSGTAPGLLAAAGDEVALDVRIVPQPLRVVSVQPAQGARNVPLSTPVTLVFSKPVDPAALTGANAGRLSLSAASGAVSGTLSLSAANTVATFWPVSLLESNTAYTFTAASAITDASGRPMAAAATVSFTTVNTTAPPPPPAGSITATIPGTDGVTTVRGTQGTAGAHDTVSIENLTTGAVTPVLLDPNGGFQVQVAAGRRDKLRLHIVGESGTETVFQLPVFSQTNADGSVTASVDASGGRVEGPNGSFVEMKPGTFPDGALVTIRALAEAAFPIQLDAEQKKVFGFAGGVQVDFNGATPTSYVNVGIAAAGGDVATDQWIVAQSVNVGGTASLSVVDTAKLIDGRVRTSSPPCPGVTAAGVYGFYKSKATVGLNYALMSSSQYGGLRVDVTIPFMTPAFAFPFAVFSYEVPQPICFPVLSGRLSVVPNTQTVLLNQGVLAPADREIVVKNALAGTESHFVRNQLEMKFKVAGATSDSFQVLLQLPDGSRIPAPGVNIVTDANDKVTVSVDADAVTQAVAFVVVINSTRSLTSMFGVAQMKISLPVTGGASDFYIVSAIDDSGAARLLVKNTDWTFDSPNGPGNLLARAIEGTIDPTHDEIVAYNAAHPNDQLPLSRSRTKVELINQTHPQTFEVPAASIVNGGFTFAFDGGMADTFALRVVYEAAADEIQTIPTFRIIVTNPVTGRVVKTITAQAPPRDEPLNLGTITDDDQPPMLVGSPARLDSFDPAAPLTFNFSESMDPASLKAAAVVEKLTSAAGATVRTRVKGTWRVYDNGKSATFIPDSPLGIGEEYSVTFPGNDALNTTGQNVNDASGNPMGTTRLSVKTFTPRLVSTVSVGRDFRPIESINHLTFERKPVAGKLKTFLLATTESRTGYKLLSIDATDAANPVELESSFGGQGKRRITLVPDIGKNGNAAIDYSRAIPQPPGAPPVCGAGTQFTGDLAITTSVVTEYSYLSFFDVNDPAKPCLIGNKLLNATPDFLNSFTTPGTVHQMGFADGVAWIRHTKGLAAYAAVRELGIMSADVGKDLGEPDPPQRMKEGVFAGDYSDIVNVDDRLVAAETTAGRLDVLDPNLSPLGTVDLGDSPRRLLFARAYGSDDNDDGIISPSEQRDLMFVAAARSIVIVDMTNLTAPSVIGRILMPGVIRNLDFDPAKRRLFAGGTYGPAASGDGFFIIDLAKPLQPPIDNDADGFDDRVVYKRNYPQTMNGFRVDVERGLAYIPTYAGLAGGPGRLDILAIYDNCCDLGVDFTPASGADRPRGDRASLLAKEKEALQKGIAAGLDKAQADCGLPVSVLTMIEQGSGACLWRGDCGSNYQPGLSDHDFELFIPQANMGASSCAVKAITGIFIDPRTSEPKPIPVTGGATIAFEDITFFPVVKELFETATFDVQPPASGGSDPIGDMGLGRRSLLMKWLLEGAYVSGVPGHNLQGRSLDAILNDLKQVKGIPFVEGYEWSNLQEYALAKSKAFVRVVGASSQDSGFHALFVKQMHDAGKAGIRAAMARMVANPAANRQLLQVTRDAYNRNACLAVDATTINPNNWKEKPCTSFEEYVASAAARTLRGTPIALFSRNEVVNQISRFYKVKADIDRITSDAQADAFAALAAQFIALGKTETFAIYNQTLPNDPDAAQRTANIGQAATNVQKALTNAKLALSPHVYNRGFRSGSNVRIAMYKTDADESGTLEKEVRQDVPGGDDRTITWEHNADGSLALANGQAVPVFSLKVDQSTDFNHTHGVSFLIDLPDKSVNEANRRNNLGGFFYYVVDRGAPTGPTIPASPFMPVPRGTLLDPDAACATGPALSMTQVVELGGRPVNGDVSVGFGEQLTIKLTVQNLSPLPVHDVVVCSNITHKCYTIGLVGANASASTTDTFTAPNSGLIIDGAATVYSPESGVIEGTTSRVIIGCESYAIVPMSYNPEKSEVQMGGSAFRYYRIINKRTGEPIPSATVTAEVSGLFGSTFGKKTYSFTTGPLGEIQTGSEVGLKLTPDSTWQSLIVGLDYFVTITAVNGVAPACSIPEKFTLTVKPRDYTLAYSRGTEIKGSAGLLFSAELGAEAGMEIEKEVNSTSGVTALSISQSFQTSGKFGAEFSLFKLKAGLGVGQVSGGAKIGTSDRSYAGKGVKLNFAYPLDPDKSCAIANLTLSGMFQVHPILTKLIDLARSKPCADLTKYVVSTSSEFGHESNESAGVKLNFGRPAPGFGDADKEIGVDFGVAASNGFGISTKYSFGYALNPTGTLETTKTTEGYTLKGGIDFSAGLSLMPQDPPAEAAEKDKAGEAEVDFFKKALDVNTSYSGNTSYNVAFTTDLAHLRADLKPNEISIGYSGPKRWGWKRDLAGAETNLGSGFTGSYSYSLDTPELVDKAIANLANLDVIHKSSARTNLANQRLQLTPTLLNTELGKFSQVFYDTPISYSVSKEKGTGFTVPFGLEGEALGIKLGFGIDFKSESKVGYTKEKGIRFRGKDIPLEVYSDTEPAPADFGLWDTVRDTWKALLASFAPEFSDVQASINRAGQQFMVLQSLFTATMTIDTTRLPDGTDVRLLSWRYTPVTVPAKDYRYMPSDSAGRGDAPHYGIGGFHQFAPDGLDLGGPTQLVIDYHDADVAGLDESSFAIYGWNVDTNDWDLMGGTVDAAANTVTTTVTKFRLYTIGAAMPARTVTLTATGGDLVGAEAEGKRRFTVTASGFVMNNGQPVANGTLYTVRSAPLEGSALVPYGTVLTADADPSADGVQVPVVNGSLTFEVEFNSPFGALPPGRAIIYSTRGTAFGETKLAVAAAGGGL